jgi:O-methyltransferase domain
LSSDSASGARRRCSARSNSESSASSPTARFTARSSPHASVFTRAPGRTCSTRFQPGDFFADPLPNADLIVLGRILHDWNLSEKQTLVTKAHEALPDGGALIVFDAIIDNELSGLDARGWIPRHLP